MPRPRAWIALGSRGLACVRLVLLWLGCAASAQGVECSPATGPSPCFDATAPWLPVNGSAFVFVPAGNALPPGSALATLGVDYQRRPAWLLAPSPDPYGRQVRLVEHRVEVLPGWAYAPRRSVELDLTLPVVAYQTGTGLDGALSQTNAGLRHTALRDPRFGVAVALPEWASDDRRTDLASKLRLEVSLPLGSAQALAGETSAVVAPSAVAQLHFSDWTLSSELGARLRPTRQIATTRLGSQLLTSLGLAYDLLPRSRLLASVESFVLFGLADQRATLPDGTRVTRALHAPAEWLASLAWRPDFDESLTLRLGAGTALPLSFEQRTSPSGQQSDTTYAGITAARLRLIALVRYVL